MTICPSKFCGKENPADSNYCTHCGIDLRMDKDEILGRDMIYTIFMDYLKERNDPEFAGILNMKRGQFDSIIEGMTGRLFIIMEKWIMRGTEVSSKQKIEKIERNIEEEKLKVLREISKSLKEMAKIGKNKKY